MTKRLPLEDPHAEIDVDAPGATFMRVRMGGRNWPIPCSTYNAITDGRIVSRHYFFKANWTEPGFTKLEVQQAVRATLALGGLRASFEVVENRAGWLAYGTLRRPRRFPRRLTQELTTISADLERRPADDVLRPSLLARRADIEAMRRGELQTEYKCHGWQRGRPRVFRAKPDITAMEEMIARQEALMALWGG